MVKASREFQIFAKPAGAACNLDCRYCYYLKKELLYEGGGPLRMADDLLEDYIRRQIDAAPGPDVHFFWHGGEPTVLGVDYFRRIVALERCHLPPGWRVSNGIQTNGILIDEALCRFFAAEGFSLGLSLDGPAALHDLYRVAKDGRPTHRQALQGYRLLLRHRVPVDILCVVHAGNVSEPLRVYRFFREIGAQYISFIPLVEPEPDSPGGVSPRTVGAEAFGAFLCAIFDEWVRNDVGRIIVQIFEEAARPACGLDHSLCIFRPTCGDVPVVEHNGDFYCCDHFVDAGHRLGNIRTTALSDLIDHPAQLAFGRAKEASLPRRCRECGVLSMCHGGCPKDRILRTPEGEAGLNWLCAGYRKFFAHCAGTVGQMAALRLAGEPPERIMASLRDAEAQRRPAVGRNDPCPCGSGKKYKKCCLNA